MTIKISSAKAKGRRLQQWVVAKLAKALMMKIDLIDPEIESRPMSQAGVDVILRGDALKAFPYSIECKSCEQWSLKAFITQAKKNNLKGTDWLLVLKSSYTNPVVVLDAERFFDLFKPVKTKECQKCK